MRFSLAAALRAPRPTVLAALVLALSIVPSLPGMAEEPPVEATAATATPAVSAPAVAAPAVAAPDEGSRVLIRVNDEPIYAEFLESVLGEIHRSQQIEERSGFDVEQLVFRVVNDTLLAQEARTLDMQELPEIQRRIAAKRESKARARIYREEILERLDPSDEKVRRVYDDVFRIATLRVVTRRERAEAEALRPRVLAARDDESFAALAKEVSQDPYSQRGGRIETAFTNLFESLLVYASSAPVGELSQPLPTQWGWTLARLEKIEPADPAQLDARRERVLVELRHRQEVELRAALAERLRPTLGLEIDWPVFDSIGVQRMHDGRLLPQFEGPERVVARAAGRVITAQDVAAKLAKAWSTLGNPTLAIEWKRSVLDNLIFEELLVAEGLRRGYGDTPEVQRALRALETSQLASRYLKDVVVPAVEVTPQEARDYYDQHRDEFRRPPKLHLLELTVATPEEGERVAALARGGADFSWLARQHSNDPRRELGGERGWVLATEGTPLFRSELAGAAAGDVLGPKQGLEGWVVLKVDLVEDQGHYDYETVSGNVRARVQSGKIVERIDTVIGRLREGAEIWIDREAIAAMSIAPTAPEDGPAMPGHEGS